VRGLDLNFKTRNLIHSARKLSKDGLELGRYGRKLRRYIPQAAP